MRKNFPLTSLILSLEKFCSRMLEIRTMDDENRGKIEHLLGMEGVKDDICQRSAGVVFATMGLEQTTQTSSITEIENEQDW